MRPPSCTHAPTMTLSGLRAFGTHCKRLLDLNISVDASTVPAFDNSPPLISQPRLRGLSVAASPISDAPNVARFVSALFPKLMFISTVYAWRWETQDATDDDEEDAVARRRHVLWKQVQAFIPVITAVRREERQWTRESDE
ncbi:hypothetical protein DFH09DRAFT_1373723 [Mycena vulgaris]|nr:hypothetical protein DFH09DRAFT_1373723 [Mycena vulgaris]